MTNQILWCCVTLLALAAAALGRPAEVDGNEFTFVEKPVDDKDVVLIPVSAEDRLDYKIDNDDGTYQYGYQSGRLGPEGGHSFKHEYRREDGVLFGQHGYELPGVLNQTINYVADARGYRVLADGQQYEPVSEEQLARQRGLLDGLLEEEQGEVPLELDLSLMDKIESPEEVQLSADPQEALAPVPLQPYSQLDPDTGAFRFGFRSVAEDGSVTVRQEKRRPDGVVIGQYGQRAAGQAGSLVRYVSDAFGYRQVDPAAKSVKVVSREQALQQLPEARSQLAEVRMAGEAEAGSGSESESESEQEMVSGMEPAMKMAQQEKEMVIEPEMTVALSEGDAAVVVDGAVGAESASPGVASGVRGSDDAVVTEALPESVAEPADPQYWAGAPLYAAALPYHTAVYTPYLGGASTYQYQTANQPGQYGYQQYQWLPYSPWYPYLAPAATPYRYQYRQQPTSYVRAKYQYPAPEYPLYEPHLYSPIANEEEESR